MDIYGYIRITDMFEECPADLYSNLCKITDHTRKVSPNCGFKDLKVKAPSCDCGELSPIGTML